jgi:hypothetical protein
LIATVTAFVSLLINIGVTIWCGRHVGFEDGLATLFSGDCHRVATMNSGIHLGINALSTALLSGSNYCMQCLCAPTRKDVQQAHSRMKWLDIGVPSARNLRHVQRHKVVLWWCLGLSSVPLHLLWVRLTYCEKLAESILGTTLSSSLRCRPTVTTSFTPLRTSLMVELTT